MEMAKNQKMPQNIRFWPAAITSGTLWIVADPGNNFNTLFCT